MASLNEKELIAELRLRLKDTEYSELEDHALWGILNACKYDLDKAEKLLIQFMEARSKLVGRRLVSFKGHVVHPEIRKCLPNKFLGSDRGGQPALWGTLVHLKVKELTNKGLKEELFLALMKVADDLVREIYENPTRKEKSGCGTVLLDMNGFSVTNFLHWETMKICMGMLKDFEPLGGLINRVYMMNCSWAFYYVLNILKPFIPKSCLESIHILDSNQTKGQKVLQDNFVMSVIPREYGGTGLNVFA